MRIIASFTILATMLALLLVLAPPETALAHQPHAATPTVRLVSTSRASVGAATPTPTAANRSVPGSTDGLVIMSFVIALIIVIPILLQRSLWGK